MKKISYIILLLVLANLPGIASAAKLLAEEGLFLDGVEGVVRKVEKVDVWNFVPDAPIALTEKIDWPAQSPISLLPCSVLEQITKLAGETDEIRVRLWGLFTGYNKNNYLYSVYFLPVEEDTDAETTTSPDTQTTGNAEQDNTNSAEVEDSIIPADILKQIKSSKTPDLKKFQQIAAVTGDTNLIGRAGYLKQDEKVKFFQPDAFGQNISLSRYLMLPCSALEDTEKELKKSLGRQRYAVSGLVTTYKGRQYMLLRRMVRTFTNGNFTP